MKAKKISKTTTSRSEFNRAYKAYHRGENDERKCYNIDTRANGQIKAKYPNWKLVSKNRKQWMEKSMIKEEKYYGGY